MTRVAVFADTHHSFKWLPFAVERLGQGGFASFTWAILRLDAEQVCEALGGVPSFAVRGNNDSGTVYPKLRIERVEDVWLMLSTAISYYTLPARWPNTRGTTTAPPCSLGTRTNRCFARTAKS